MLFALQRFTNSGYFDNIKNMNHKTNTQQNPYLIPAAIIVAGILIAGAVFLGRNVTPGQEDLAARNIQVELDGWQVVGNPEAKVLIVEYSDYACPFCKKLHDEIIPLIKEQYVDTGKVRYVYKDFIVVGGDRAAEAAHCAAQQGAFWQYNSLLFERQPQDRERWSDPNVHRAYAEELGLDADALVECFEERRFREKVLASTQEAQANGGRGTPITFINNTPIVGAEPFSVFQEVIEAYLRGEFR